MQASFAADPRAWRELARRVEGNGYSSFFMPDHLGMQWGPLVGLTVAAEATTALKVGTLVLDNDFRHPMVVAKELATLDLVSEGRLEVGIGAGWQLSDYEQSGIPFDPAPARITKLGESVHMLKSLWSGNAVDFDGEHYKLRSAASTPVPVSAPHPAIIIGGGGKRVLSLAAREADIVGVNPNLAAGKIGPQAAATATNEHYRKRRAWVKEAAGDRFSQLELQCWTFSAHVAQNGREIISAVASGFGVDSSVVANMPIVLVGTLEQVVESLQRHREELGLSYWVVHEPEMEDFAPVVARLAGT